MASIAFDSLIFDLDGTLWDASTTSAKAWSRVAAELNLPHVITPDEVRSVSGLPFEECIQRLFSRATTDPALLRDRLDHEEKTAVIQDGGSLYPGVGELIAQFKRKYRLFIVSNCQDWYLESFLDHSRLATFFDDVTCHGKTGLTKAENIRRLVNQHQMKNPVYIGDTQWDQSAANTAGVPFVFAQYGFGSISTAGCTTVASFNELASLFLDRSMRT